MSLRPLHDRVIIERLDEGEQQIGGIIIPDTAKEKPQRGKVIAAGMGRQRPTASGFPLTSRRAISFCLASTPGRKSSSTAGNTSIMKEEEVLAILQAGSADAGVAARPATVKKRAVVGAKRRGPSARRMGHRPGARTPSRTSKTMKKKTIKKKKR